MDHWAIRKMVWIGEGAMQQEDSSIWIILPRSIGFKMGFKDCFFFPFCFFFFFCGINGSIEWSILIIFDTVPIERKREGLNKLTNGVMQRREVFGLCTGIGVSLLSSWTLSASLARSYLWGLEGGICWCWCNCTNQVRKIGDYRL